MFFTVVTYNRQDFLVSEQARRCLKAAWRYVAKLYPFKLIALALLPEHLHCIWKMPDHDPGFSIRWGMIKKCFSQHYARERIAEFQIKDSMRKRRESGLWQRRFWDHVIRDVHDFEAHFDYIHYNPVKHGLVKRPVDWPWSTFHRYAKSGVYDEEWGSTLIDFGEVQNFGE